MDCPPVLFETICARLDIRYASWNCRDTRQHAAYAGIVENLTDVQLVPIDLAPRLRFVTCEKTQYVIMAMYVSKVMFKSDSTGVTANNRPISRSCNT